MLGVGWSHALLALPFITFLLFVGSYKEEEIDMQLEDVSPIKGSSCLHLSHKGLATFATSYGT